MGIFDRFSHSVGKQPGEKKSATAAKPNQSPGKRHCDKGESLPATPTSKLISFGMEAQPVGIGASSSNYSHTAAVRPVGDGTMMHVNEDGSYLVVDANGVIIRTCDVLGVKREFSVDKFSGQLMIKRFGAWTKPASAKVETDGTFAYTQDDIDVVEQLNGVHMQNNRDTGTTIITNHPEQVEIVRNPNGEITKRQATKDGENFSIWSQQSLTFFSETFYQPRRHEAITPNGGQPLVYVSRAERRLISEGLMHEKFFFRNPNNNDRSVTLSVQLSTGLLMLKGIVSVTTVIRAHSPVETIFEFKHPCNLRVVLSDQRGVLEQIVQLRVFDATASAEGLGEIRQIGLAFKNSSDQEQISYIAKREGSPASVQPGMTAGGDDVALRPTQVTTAMF